MDTNKRMSAYDAAVYLTNRHNSGAWHDSDGPFPDVTVAEICDHVIYFAEEDEMCIRRTNFTGVTEGAKPFLTREDIDAMGILTLEGEIPFNNIIIGHDLMSEHLTIEIIRAVNADHSLRLPIRQNLLYRTHSIRHTTDAILAALYETDPVVSLIRANPHAWSENLITWFTNPKIGPKTVAAWLKNPSRFIQLEPEEIVCLLSQDGIPEKDRRTLVAMLLQFPDERLIEMESCWQDNLNHRIAEITSPDFRYAHLIGDELRSRLLVLTALA